MLKLEYLYILVSKQHLGIHKVTETLTKHSFSTKSFLHCKSLKCKQTYGQQAKCPPVTYLLDHREYVCVRRRSQSVEVRGYMLTSYVCLVWYMNLKNQINQDLTNYTS